MNRLDCIKGGLGLLGYGAAAHWIDDDDWHCFCEALSLSEQIHMVLKSDMAMS